MLDWNATADKGHPIRVGHETLDGALGPHLEPRLKRIQSRQSGRNPDAHYGVYLLIGEKRGL